MLTISRRQLALGGLIFTGVRAGPQEKTAPGGTIVSTRGIHFEGDFKATPKRMYEALLDAKQFREFSGMAAKIDRQPGGAFSLFEGNITGRNIELIADRRIVQAWRSGWSEGVFSIVRFQLDAQGAGTHLIFAHTGFPPDQAEHLVEGWQDHYWGPLRKYFG
jgi:activator of HSP90 ATPase